MNFENRPTHSLQPYARNARTHSPKQIKQIALSIERFGFNNPLLIDDGDQILAGHGRLLAAAEGTVLASAGQTPSELAYTEILQEMKADFPNIGWEALRNKHTSWKNGHFHSVENDIDSDDFEAEIERLFPRPPRS